MSEELKPCPFCKGEASFYTEPYQTYGGYVAEKIGIYCRNCFASVDVLLTDRDFTREIATGAVREKWNTRTPDTSAKVDGWRCPQISVEELAERHAATNWHMTGTFNGQPIQPVDVNDSVAASVLAYGGKVVDTIALKSKAEAWDKFRDDMGIDGAGDYSETMLTIKKALSNESSAVELEIKESLEEAKENLRLALMSKISLNKQLAEAVEPMKALLNALVIAPLESPSGAYLKMREQAITKAEQWLKKVGE